MMVRSYSLRSSPRMMSSRLPTESVTRTPGHSRWKAATIDGARYFAVLTTPNTSEPEAPASSASMRSLVRAASRSTSLAIVSSSWPISVGVKGASPARRNSGAPTCSSSNFNWTLIAGGVTWSTVAAPLTEPRSTVAASARNCFRVRLLKSDI